MRHSGNLIILKSYEDLLKFFYVSLLNTVFGTSYTRRRLCTREVKSFPRRWERHRGRWETSFPTLLWSFQSQVVHLYVKVLPGELLFFFFSLLVRILPEGSTLVGVRVTVELTPTPFRPLRSEFSCRTFGLVVTESVLLSVLGGNRPRLGGRGLWH